MKAQITQQALDSLSTQLFNHLLYLENAENCITKVEYGEELQIPGTDVVIVPCRDKSDAIIATYGLDEVKQSDCRGAKVKCYKIVQDEALLIIVRTDQNSKRVYTNYKFEKGFDAPAQAPTPQLISEGDEDVEVS